MFKVTINENGKGVLKQKLCKITSIVDECLIGPFILPNGMDSHQYLTLKRIIHAKVYLMGLPVQFDCTVKIQVRKLAQFCHTHVSV